MGRPIRYATERSGFLKEALSWLGKASFDAPVVLRLRAVKEGYRGTVTVQLSEDLESFVSDYAGEDPTRFPARIRAVATALWRLGHRGTFRISHDNGIVTIESR